MAKDASGWVEEMLREIDAEPRQDAPENGQSLGFSQVLGRRVRTGGWTDQKVSTWRKIHDALDKEDYREAAALIDFFTDEADVIYSIFRQLIPDVNEYLLQRGLSKQEIREINTRVLALLRLPDGRPFKPRRLWEEFRDMTRELIVLCGERRTADVRVSMEPWKERWRLIQDRDVDHCYGIINEIVERFGETALAEMWEFIIGPLFKMRYAKFDIGQFPWNDALPLNMYLAFEAMRGHLVGPDRTGDMEFSEDADRYTLRFDPCGSGGRILRGDAIEGTPPRTDAPYSWGVTQEEHDFAWRRKGVCYYCSNCCLVLQLKPIDVFGYPVRVVEPPTYPSETAAKCTWHIYKDPTAVPERYYEAVGRKRPEKFGSAPAK
jgi:hypothetical protein